MFQEDDTIYHKKYGIGKILYAGHYVSKIKFELKNEDLPRNKIIIIKNDELKLLDEIIEVGSKVKNIRLGYRTILRIHTSYENTKFLVEFDKEHYLLCRIYMGEDNNSAALKRNRLWCILKYDEFNGFEIIDSLDDIHVSSTVILRDIYDNVRQDLPEREKEFLSNVRKQDLDLLDRMLTSKIKNWIVNKKYGERKNE